MQSLSRRKLNRVLRYRTQYLFMLPAIVWFVLFCYVPMYGLALGFREFRFDVPLWRSQWIGMRYFEQFIRNSQFGLLFANTVRISLLRLLFGFPAPVLLALMINELRCRKLQRSIQTVSYLPYFVSWVVVVAILQKFISPVDGLVNELRLKWFGLPANYYLGKAGWFDPIVIFTYVWKNVGWSSIIYLATISGIDPELYEAAYIDGAGKFRSIVHITIPALYPTMCILFLLSLGGIMSAGYEQIILLKTPGNNAVAQILDTHIIEQGLRQGRYSYATVGGLFQGAIGLVLVSVVNAFTKRTTGVSIW